MIGEIMAFYFFFVIITLVIGFIVWVAITRWLFRVNDIHDELVRIRTAIESMDNYIVGVRKEIPKEIKKEVKRSEWDTVT